MGVLHNNMKKVHQNMLMWEPREQEQAQALLSSAVPLAGSWNLPACSEEHSAPPEIEIR